jgi:hypothetical protein
MGRLLLKTMVQKLAEGAKYLMAKPRSIWQRVEESPRRPFHLGARWSKSKSMKRRSARELPATAGKLRINPPSLKLRRARRE